MTAPPFSPENLASRSKEFEATVACLTEEKQASAYGYDKGLTPENQKAFREFLERAARSRKN